MPNIAIPEIEVPEEFISDLNDGNIPAEVIEQLRTFVEGNFSGLVVVEPASPPTVVPESAEYTHKLGTHNLPNQTRLHKHGTFDYRFETRSQKIQVSVVFRHPTMGDFVNDAVTCVGVAGVGSVVAAALSSPAAGLALFKPAWQACMIAKVGQQATQIDVQIKTDTVTGPWSGH